MLHKKTSDPGVFIIGASGLRPLEGQQLFIGVGAQYYIGASSSPKHVVITGLTSDAVFYRQSSYKTDTRCELNIFRDLAKQGCETWLSTYGTIEHPLAGTIRKVLAGEPVLPVKAEDLQRVFALVRTIKPTPNAWHEFEALFSDRIGGDISGECPEGFQVWCDRGTLPQLATILAGSNFEHVGVRDIAF